MGETYKREYSGQYQSLEAIWSVLRAYSSEEHPLSVTEIFNYLKKTEETPRTRQRLERLLTQEDSVIHTLFPTLELREEKPPSYSTVDNHLKRILTSGGGTTYQLCCVAHKRRWNGEVQTIPYEDIEMKSTDVDEGGKQNNVPRRYYLKGPLSRGAWRFLSDFVRDCPCITRRQTEQLLSALDLLVQPARPRASQRPFSKPGRSAVLSAAGRIDRALQERKKLLVTVGSYKLLRCDGRLAPVLKEERQAVLEPYGLAWSGGRCWLVGREQETVILPLDRLLGAELLEETFTPPGDFDPAAYVTASPQVFPGGAVLVRLRCSPELLEDAAELLGRGAQYAAPRADGSFEVTARAAPECVRSFALTRPDGVEVLEPEELRRDILCTLRRGMERYGP